MKDRRLTRRSLLKAGAALALPAIIPARALGREDKVAASERITLGFIGVGGMGGAHLGGFLRNPRVDVIAV